MSSSPFNEEETKKLLEAQAHIHNYIFNFLNSMALKCALQLNIPDTIHKHGEPMTLSELASSLSIHSSKVPSLYRLIRLLVSSNFLEMKTFTDGEERFSLTLSSELLVNDHPLTLSPFALTLLDPALVNPAHHLSSWFQTEAKSSFHIANHGMSFWEHASLNPEFSECFNQAMECDSRFVTSLLVTNKEFRGLFDGIETLVDVGGGNGTTAKAISEAFPWLKCSVLDLPHVVSGLQEQQNNVSNIMFIAGDMFQAIPSADAILLKWILHDWGDEECIKILQRCKEAIGKKHGGKVIIIDIVIDIQSEDAKSNTHILFDMEMMSLNGQGKERTKHEWENLFIQAGFNAYHILPILGLRSVIEVFP
ncbi:unnamed protein product [Amaranthus hypochondriacus]